MTDTPPPDERSQRYLEALNRDAEEPRDQRQGIIPAVMAVADAEMKHLRDRANKAEAAIARVESYAHELRHKDAMGLLAALDAPADEPGKECCGSKVGHYPGCPANAAPAKEGPHRYLSTGCLHGEHDYCQSHTGLSGAKAPAVCKFCKAPCQCPCHRITPAEEKP
ncbi:hypothetical protein [Streptomyces sp. Ac-502]|uniref:hypothetical protein n=1 Tax=Streptomyces sp. Ac-502 TaxID=3342801 RepID=UPI003862B00B